MSSTSDVIAGSLRQKHTCTSLPIQPCLFSRFHANEGPCLKKPKCTGSKEQPSRVISGFHTLTQMSMSTHKQSMKSGIDHVLAAWHSLGLWCYSLHNPQWVSPSASCRRPDDKLSCSPLQHLELRIAEVVNRTKPVSVIPYQPK